MISVIIPVYNCEKYIKKCIKSILNQTYKDLEVIIIDDGSKDNSLDICNKLMEEDCRLKVIHQENQGVSSARNKGIEIAQGEYIVFVDGDDWVEDIYIETLINDLQKEDAGMAVCGWCRENVNGLMQESVKYYYKILNQREAIAYSLKPDGFQGYLWNKIFRKNIINKANLYFDTDIAIFEDLLFVIKYLNFCKKIVVNYISLYHYVNHGDSARQDCSNNKKFQLKWLTEIEAMSRVINVIEDKEIKNYARSKKALSCGFYIKRMYDCNYINKKVENKLKKYIRKNLYYIWKYKAGDNIWRGTTIICGFFPRIERLIHKILAGER